MNTLLLSNMLTVIGPLITIILAIATGLKAIRRAPYTTRQARRVKRSMLENLKIMYDNVRDIEGLISPDIKLIVSSMVLSIIFGGTLGYLGSYILSFGNIFFYTEVPYSSYAWLLFFDGVIAYIIHTQGQISRVKMSAYSWSDEFSKDYAANEVRPMRLNRIFYRLSSSLIELIVVTNSFSFVFFAFYNWRYLFSDVVFKMIGIWNLLLFVIIPVVVIPFSIVSLTTILKDDDSVFCDFLDNLIIDRKVEVRIEVSFKAAVDEREHTLEGYIVSTEGDLIVREKDKFHVIPWEHINSYSFFSSRKGIPE